MLNKYTMLFALLFVVSGGVFSSCSPRVDEEFSLYNLSGVKLKIPKELIFAPDMQFFRQINGLEESDEKSVTLKISDERFRDWFSGYLHQSPASFDEMFVFLINKNEVDVVGGRESLTRDYILRGGRFSFGTFFTREIEGESLVSIHDSESEDKVVAIAVPEKDNFRKVSRVIATCRRLGPARTEEINDTCDLAFLVDDLFVSYDLSFFNMSRKTEIEDVISQKIRSWYVD